MVDLLVYTNHRMGDMYYNRRGRSSITAVAGPASAWTWWEPIRPIAGVEWSQFLASTDASHRALPAHVCHSSAACVSQSLQLGEVL